MPKRIPLRERFYSRVQDGPNGCRLWTGSSLGGGYGGFSIGDKTMYAHRVAWELERGPLEPGRRITLIPFKENVLRGIGPTAMNSKKSHCKHGHELTGANIYESQSGRRCKPCAQRRANEAYLRRTA